MHIFRGIRNSEAIVLNGVMQKEKHNFFTLGIQNNQRGFRNEFQKLNFVEKQLNNRAVVSFVYKLDLKIHFIWRFFKNLMHDFRWPIW